MSDKKSRQELIDDLTLALFYLTRFNDGYGAPFNELSWKGYDHDGGNVLLMGLDVLPEYQKQGLAKEA